ncbi:F0F1 ATP synthase subunit gamma [Aquifex aeolicus]|uniref:ATP synthase F1 gamma subunit n=1 Tax=Aquifex aeolicus (strain VF5) TaxID=224324 RepID=O66581_AQUAE|nr:FoF1 ATP synthase subunit gamma [Aquifex aeolicus]AAC06541.1 ATP synthase F1 gamma subunit [Aquifex aeolicus VF5]
MKKLSEKLRAYEVLREVFNVIAVISLNRFKKTRHIVSQEYPYFERLKEVLEHLFALHPTHPLFKPREEKRVSVVVFTSDLSFTRELCNKIFKSVPEFRETEFIIFGGKCRKKDLFERLKPKVISNTFTKLVDYSKILKTFEELFERFASKELDAVYVVSALPFLERAEGKGKRETGKSIKEEEVKREILYTRGARYVRAVELGESGRIEVYVERFLPPKIKGVYRKDLILNFEGNEEEIIRTVLKLYTEFHAKFLSLAHWNALNLQRFRTAKRIQDNLERKIKNLKRLISKERQEKINRELQDIALSLLALEEKKFKDIEHKDYVLEIDKNLEESLKKKVIEILKEHFPILEVKEVEGLLGFYLRGEGKVYNASTLKQLELFVREIILRVDRS